MIEMKCLAGRQHRVQGEDRTYLVIKSPTFTAGLSVLILLKMIESIDMTLCVISFLVYSKIEVYRGIPYFLIFALKHRLWVLIRTASMRRL